MHDLCLLCKSYHRDFLRLKRLLESIQVFNKDDIPVYVSTPEDERELLESVIGSEFDYQWVSDEEIIRSNPMTRSEVVAKTAPYVAQGIIKAEFWRLGLAENYFCIDSDSRFLRHFSRSDFIHASGTPYTVFHENKELLQIARNRGKHRVVSDHFAEINNSLANDTVQSDDAHSVEVDDTGNNSHLQVDNLNDDTSSRSSNNQSLLQENILM